jgi:hypothetical protein
MNYLRKPIFVWLCLPALLAILSSVRADEPTPAIEAVPGRPTLQLSAFDLNALGFTTEEFFVSGTASSYKLADAPTAATAQTSPYATRMVVVRPANPRKFNGTAVVEWLNVSAGGDGAAEWISLHREILRGGYAYVGVSVQKAGIENAPGLLGAGNSLKKVNAERYARLSHPGDTFSFDMYSQAGRALRIAGNRVLGGLRPKRVIAVGESQSAAFLTTYINAIDPLAKVYDGFLVHSRFGNAASLETGSMMATASTPAAVTYRPGLRVPVLTVITETDLLATGLLGYYAARQSDTDKLRVWEVTGTAHADAYMLSIAGIDSGSTPLEKIAAGYAPTNKTAMGPVALNINNAAQHHYVVEAALWNLNRWIKSGRAAPKAEPMTVKAAENARPTLVLDSNGLALGGVRTPWVDVPIERTSGLGNSGGPLGSLVGSCGPFDAATLARLYPGGKREYLKKFEASLSRAIKAGFILPADKKEILGLAAIRYPGSQ